MSEAQRPEPALDRKPAERKAAERKLAEDGGEKSVPLAPGDFYMENGLLVFTAAYHLKRGYCCNSGCRHCPYR
jgi:hypothetical protein